MTAGSNPLLERLDVLVGEWELTMSIDGRTLSGGRATFEWMAGGGAVVYRGEAEETSDLATGLGDHSPFPTVSVIGVDDSSEQYTMLYSDDLGVSRVYQMRLSDGRWELWRDRGSHSGSRGRSATRATPSLAPGRGQKRGLDGNTIST